MILILLGSLGFVCSLIPAYMTFRNLSVFGTLPMTTRPANGLPALSVLIPARNEEASIGDCLEAVLDSEGVNFEVVVLDDNSEDGTADLVARIASADDRLRLERARELPIGWCGKQFACAQLGDLANNDVFVFIDSDVRLSSDALRRVASRFGSTQADLLSGFPRQVTVSLAEQLLIPLIHFILLGFLSLRRMRQSGKPAFGAGCGQMFVTSRTAYEQSGGHAGIRESLHDGLKLPRLYRSKGLKTDLFDATDMASCRMYHNASEVWFGLQKNATEGVASRGLIVPVTLLLFCGQVLPFLLLAWILFVDAPPWLMLVVAAACCLAIVPRIVTSIRFRQSIVGAILHPLAILMFLAAQWSAFAGSLRKRQVSWKGRAYPA